MCLRSLSRLVRNRSSGRYGTQRCPGRCRPTTALPKSELERRSALFRRAGRDPAGGEGNPSKVPGGRPNADRITPPDRPDTVSGAGNRIRRGYGNAKRKDVACRLSGFLEGHATSLVGLRLSGVGGDGELRRRTPPSPVLPCHALPAADAIRSGAAAPSPLSASQLSQQVEASPVVRHHARRSRVWLSPASVWIEADSLLEPLVEGVSIEALSEIAAPRAQHAAGDRPPSDPVLSEDSRDLARVHAAREMRREPIRLAVIAVVVQALGHGLKAGSPFDHRPGKVVVVGPHRVQRFIEASYRERLRSPKAEQVLDRRPPHEVFESEGVVTSHHTASLTGVVDDPARRVEKVDLGMSNDIAVQDLDRVRRPQVIAEKQRDELGPGAPDARVDRARELPPLVRHHDDARVGQLTLEHRCERVNIRGLDHDDGSPGGAALDGQGVESLAQEALLVMFQWNDRGHRRVPGSPTVESRHVSHSAEASTARFATSPTVARRPRSWTFARNSSTRLSQYCP